MSLKRRVVAYCSLCDKLGRSTLLVPYGGAGQDDDYLCVVCWLKVSLEDAQALHEKGLGKYRGEDGHPKHTRKVYLASDGFKTDDGRVFGAYSRLTGAKLKYIKTPI